MSAKRILIVEDDVDILRLLSRELEDAGFEVMAFDSGMRGLSAVRESSPDLVILDLGLPDISGQEIARRLRHTGNTPSSHQLNIQPWQRLSQFRQCLF